MSKYSLLITGLVFICIPTIGFSTPNFPTSDNAQCGDRAKPLLSVSDFNGDGKVSWRDMHMIRDALRAPEYFSLYDRNADGRLNYYDLHLAKRDWGKKSTSTDRQITKMYQRFKHIQSVSGFEEVGSMNYQPFGGVFAFHGQHWANTAGQFAIGGLREPDPFIAEGINVMGDGSSIPALFWGDGAVPLFNDPSATDGLSTLDWPDPAGIWNFERVQAFGSHPPDFFPNTEQDNWHPHVGLCVTLQDLGNGPEWISSQHTSNAECQATPNLAKIEFNGQKVNAWGNFWMLHTWLFKLNPNGVFGGTHPCVDPDGPSLDVINGGREVPRFFQTHGGSE